MNNSIAIQEQGGTIVNDGAFEFSEHYAVTREGNVISLRKGIILKPRTTTNGYLEVRGLSVHRLVASAFCPNPECKPHVNHKDANKKNNHWTNLEWVTARENAAHAISLGLQPLTERMRSARRQNAIILNKGKRLLSFEEATRIRSLYGRKDVSYAPLAECFGVSVMTISRIVRGLIYASE